ncbi:hypothetical protein HYQ46_004365 [Verticillium longisporum]|nr:hypothetical protein HYQ46_004365 [Verticillium longisporum]
MVEGKGGGGEKTLAGDGSVRGILRRACTSSDLDRLSLARHGDQSRMSMRPLRNAPRRGRLGEEKSSEEHKSFPQTPPNQTGRQRGAGLRLGRGIEKRQP